MRRWFLICSVLFLLLFTACKVDNLVSQGTIRFNPNGGSGYMTAQTVFAGQPQKLFTNAYTRDDYYFLGWNTQKDGAGTFYKENETYTYDGKESEMNLYAQWKKGEGTYSICFVDLMNGYESKTIEVGYGQEYKLPSIKTLFIHENNFIEWNTASSGSGDSYANEAVVKNLAQPGRTVYLYARWAIEISYDINGGSMYNPIDSIIVKSLDNMSLYSNEPPAITPPSIPEDLYDPPLNDKFYPGYVFRGWCTDRSCCYGTVYIKKDGKIEGTAPAEDTTLYALWGYNYHTDEDHQNPTNAFFINASSFVRHCEQLLDSKERKLKIAEYMRYYSNCVVLATGPLYSVKSIAGQEKGELITKKISNNSRYCYVIWDYEKDTYASLELYGHPENFIWKDNDTDVLVIAELIKDSSFFDYIASPSKDYMSSWGNPTIREPGDQVDPIIFRTLFPGSAPYAPEYIYSSTPTGVPGEYYRVATFTSVEGGFWSAGVPEENCNMVLTARF